VEHGCFTQALSVPDLSSKRLWYLRRYLPGAVCSTLFICFAAVIACAHISHVRKCAHPYRDGMLLVSSLAHPETTNWCFVLSPKQTQVKWLQGMLAALLMVLAAFSGATTHPLP
jgi:hypothetical protein